MDPKSQPTYQDHPPISKKPRNPFKLATIVLAVFVLTLASLSIYQLLNKSENNTEKTDTSKQTQTPDANRTNELAVREVIASIKTKVDEFMGDWHFVTTFDFGSTPFYKPEVAKTGIPLNKTFGLYMFANLYSQENQDKLMSEELSNLIKQTFDDLGFASYNQVASNASNNPQYIHPTKEILCQYASRSNPFNLSCSHTSWINADNITFINQLAEAYRTKEGNYPNLIIANQDNIKDSSHTPYQRLVVVVSNAAGLFYRTSPKTSWNFFVATQSELPL